jgi:hypothetical protein
MSDHEIVTPTAAQTTEWKQSAQPLHKQWSDAVRKTSADPDAILKDLRTALEQNKAQY